MKKWLCFLTALSLILTVGCTDLHTPDQPTETVGQTEPVTTQNTEKMFTDRDKNTDFSQKKAVLVELNGTTATATSDSVRIDGGVVTLTSDETYLLSGTLEDGCIVVAAGEKDKPHLILDGVSVQSSSTAALLIRQADKVVVTLTEGTENTLSNGGGFSEDGVDGVLFSKEDLSINGSGKLTVTSQTGHGIVCKDDLVFTGGSYQIHSAAHGMDVNDSVRITGDTALTVVSGKDGIHCENADDPTLGFVYIENGTFKITAEADGISAGGYALVQDGNFDILTGGGSVNGTKEHSDFFGGFMGGKPGVRPMENQTTEESTSMKGLKAAGDLTLNGGNFVMDTADDAIHSNTSITVNEGTYQIKSGDDAFHGEETLTVLGGTITVETGYEGLEAHKVYIKGGDIVLHTDDDGINAAGGRDESGTEGGRDGMFGGGRQERPMGGGRPGGFMGGGSSDGVIEISGGSLKIHASGDGLDANGGITVSGGNLYVANPTAGDTSVLDADTGAVITGGTFIGTGSTTMMAQSFADTSTQGVIARTLGNQAPGTQVTVTDMSGNMLVSFEIEYNSVLMIVSTPQLQKGESYNLTVGETSGSVQAS